MLKLLTLSIVLFSIQSFTNLSASEYEFSQVLNGKYTLIKEDLGRKSDLSCDKEISLSVEDKKLIINNDFVIEFLNSCVIEYTSADSKYCDTSTSLSFESQKYFTLPPEEDEKLNEHTKYFKIALTGFKNDKLITKEEYTERTGNETFFNRALVRKVKCTYQRIL